MQGHKEEIALLWMEWKKVSFSITWVLHLCVCTIIGRITGLLSTFPVVEGVNLALGNPCRTLNFAFFVHFVPFCCIIE